MNTSELPQYFISLPLCSATIVSLTNIFSDDCLVFISQRAEKNISASHNIIEAGPSPR